MLQVGEWWLEKPKAPLMLSVVITNYNYVEYLARAVASVVSQMDPRTELLVVDDGSNDGSVELLRTIVVGENCRSGFLEQANAGPAAARNAAARLCQGEWILFLDADDELAEDAIKYAIDVLLHKPRTDLLLGGAWIEFEDGRERYQAPSNFPEVIEERLVRYLMEKKISVSHGSSVFRRECVLARPYPEILRQAEDIAVFAFMLSQKYCERIDVPLARIHKHSDSLRNDVRLTITNSHLVAEEVFSTLPGSMAQYVRPYKARRALSAFRTCYKAGLIKEAKQCYRLAVSISPAQAIKLKHVFKYFKLLFLCEQRSES